MGLQTRAGRTNLDATMECVWRAARCAMVTESAGMGVMRQTATMGVCLAQTNFQHQVKCFSVFCGMLKEMC
jgi:hypothetical protein